jgi:hypothetical protein
MRRTGRNAIYNARKLHMSVSPGLVRVTATSLFVLLFVLNLSATNWHDAEEQLARKIAAVTGPSAMALDVTNRSTLAQTEVDEIRRGLQSDLAATGVHLVSQEEAAVSVQVTLSENLQNYVWAAEIHQGENQSSIVMASLPRDSAPSSESPVGAVVIRKTLLWTSDEPILDAAVISDNPAHMLILEPEHVELYKFQDNRWQVEQTLAISHQHQWPRDLRGRLVLRKDHLFDAYLPGVFCRSGGSGTSSLNCYETDDPWPLAPQFGLSAFFAPNRNFFTGALSPGIGTQTSIRPFYSAAPLPRDKYTLWVLASVDGQVELMDGITDQTVAKLGWGSDLAAVRSACGTGWQILATSNGDGTNDFVEAFEIADREPGAVSQPTQFAGNITALWTDPGGAGAIAVSHDSGMAKYEAYHLNISCGQ